MTMEKLSELGVMNVFAELPLPLW